MITIFACEETNDLYTVLCAAAGPLPRHDRPADAVASAPEGGSVAILASTYPESTTRLTPELLEAATEKSLRLYVEFPSWLPDLDAGDPQGTHWERAVVASDKFLPGLEPLRILAAHDCRFLPVHAPDPDIVVARVAGFDHAVYGLPDDAWPILFQHPSCDMLVATTKLSQFVTARFAPADAWQVVWQRVLEWLEPSEDAPVLEWTPVVRPTFRRNEPLPAGIEQRAMRRGVQWFFNAGLLVHPEWAHLAEAHEEADLVGEATPAERPIGDGSRGVLEGVSSAVDWQGRQPIRYCLRNDCIGEASMALAFDGVLHDDDRGRTAAANVGDFIYFTSEITKGPRSDPKAPSFGLMSWDVNISFGVFYGDDNARSLLGTLACAALLDVDRWDEKALRCLLANLRTTGRLGFRGRRLDQEPLHETGWRHHFELDTVHYAPHYEAYLWACFLWAYDRTGYEPFIERTKQAIRMTMAAYPDEWQWTNGLQQERARMLLPLAWLVRVEDTAEHRGWLRTIAEDLVSFQDESGAIREELGRPSSESYEPPKSNEEYGTREAPLIQQNGDPLCDLLYTANFAFLGLHEAAAATGDPFLAGVEDRLAEFLCRIQIRAERHPELDGGWFRGIDFERWEYWGSNADLGWGTWSIESGWTCAWIVSVLAMRRMGTSLWQLTRNSRIRRHLDTFVPAMFEG